QAFRDPETPQVGGIERSVAGERRTRDQGLDAAEADRLARDREVVDEAARRLLSPVELEAQHAAEAGEQLAGPRMARMALEPRIVDPPHPGSRRQESRDPQRALVLMAHPQGERLQTAVEQEAGVRVERAAEEVGPVTDLLDELGAADHRSRHDIPTAVQILGAAVERQVEPALQRAEVDRRR